MGGKIGNIVADVGVNIAQICRLGYQYWKGSKKFEQSSDIDTLEQNSCVM